MDVGSNVIALGPFMTVMVQARGYAHSGAETDAG